MKRRFDKDRAYVLFWGFMMGICFIGMIDFIKDMING